MDRDTRTELDRINRDFYDRYARQFSQRRSRPWRGWRPLLDSLDLPRRQVLRVLDAGCGNARFVVPLERHLASLGMQLDYLGIDRSVGLLAEAAGACRGIRGRCRLVAGDLFGRDPLGARASGLDLIALFGVLHHVPSFGLRRRLLAELAARLAPGGHLLFSVWRFDRDRRILERSARLAAHLRGTQRLDLTLDAGDYLMPWGHENSEGIEGDAVMRYCHLVEDRELEALLEGLPLTITADLEDDGHDGRLNRYLALARSST